MIWRLRCKSYNRTFRWFHENGRFLKIFSSIYLAKSWQINFNYSQIVFPILFLNVLVMLQRKVQLLLKVLNEEIFGHIRSSLTCFVHISDISVKLNFPYISKFRFDCCNSVPSISSFLDKGNNTEADSDWFSLEWLFCKFWKFSL